MSDNFLRKLIERVKSVKSNFDGVASKVKKEKELVRWSEITIRFFVSGLSAGFARLKTFRISLKRLRKIKEAGRAIGAYSLNEN